MKRASTLLTRLAALWAALVLSLTTVLAAEGDILFLDVSGDAWYAEAVQYVRGHGIMNGTTATTFSPGQIMTRGMLVTVLYRAAGAPQDTEPPASFFSDVPSGTWCADAVYWGGRPAWSQATETGDSAPTTR